MSATESGSQLADSSMSVACLTQVARVQAHYNVHRSSRLTSSELEVADAATKTFARWTPLSHETGPRALRYRRSEAHADHQDRPLPSIRACAEQKCASSRRAFVPTNGPVACDRLATRERFRAGHRLGRRARNRARASACCSGRVLSSTKRPEVAGGARYPFSAARKFGQVTRSR